MKVQFFRVLFCIVCLALMVNAQTGGTFDLSHNVIAAGGGSVSTGGTFTIDGTIGQSLAGTQSTGGTFNLRGGFWPFGARPLRLLHRHRSADASEPPMDAVYEASGLLWSMWRRVRSFMRPPARLATTASARFPSVTAIFLQ